MSNTIKLLFTGHHEEAPANAALSPGNLIELLSTGKVRKHATEGVAVVKAFAFEDALQGKTVDDAYAADDVVFYGIPNPGDVVNALLEAGINYAKGAKLYSAGNGTLTTADGLSTNTVGVDILAEVKDAIDLSGTGAVNTLSAVRIL